MKTYFAIGRQYTEDPRALSHCGSAPDFPWRERMPLVDVALFSDAGAWQETHYGMVPARVDRCECWTGVAPGVLLMNTAGGDVENVERCDLCMTYATDDAAADALRALGWTIEEEEFEFGEDGTPFVAPLFYLVVRARPGGVA
jgi:hypothetical protein